ncbi:MAG: hypothetical protein OEM92_08985 [Gammaproteobacteria bacterium]|nr:hypothetical protein [Gammaproteobacteria bacterium]
MLQMLKRHKIGEAPTWQRKLTVFVGSLFAATLLLFTVWAIILFINTADIDECLDDGGSYDYERGRCDFEVNHPGP